MNVLILYIQYRDLELSMFSSLFNEYIFNIPNVLLSMFVQKN
jgi:hypothetical protein